MFSSLHPVFPAETMARFFKTLVFLAAVTALYITTSSYGVPPLTVQISAVARWYQGTRVPLTEACALLI